MIKQILGGLDTFIVNVFAGMWGRLAPPFAGGAGAAAPCFMVWTMDYGPWSIFRGLWSMVHFGHHFPEKSSRVLFFAVHRCPPGTRQRIQRIRRIRRIHRKRCQEPRIRPSLSRAGVFG